MEIRSSLAAAIGIIAALPRALHSPAAAPASSCARSVRRKVCPCWIPRQHCRILPFAQASHRVGRMRRVRPTGPAAGFCDHLLRAAEGLLRAKYQIEALFALQHPSSGGAADRGLDRSDGLIHRINAMRAALRMAGSRNEGVYPVTPWGPFVTECVRTGPAGATPADWMRCRWRRSAPVRRMR